MTLHNFSEQLKNIGDKWVEINNNYEKLYDKMNKALLNYPNPSVPPNYYIIDDDLPFTSLEDILNNEDFQKHINKGDYQNAIDYTYNICSSSSIIAQVIALLNRVFNYRVGKRFHNLCIEIFNEKIGLQLKGPHDTIEMIREFGNDFYHMGLYLDVGDEWKINIKRKAKGKDWEEFDNMRWNDFLLFLCDLRPSKFKKEEMDKYKINYGI